MEFTQKEKTPSEQSVHEEIVAPVQWNKGR